MRVLSTRRRCLSARVVSHRRQGGRQDLLLYNQVAMEHLGTPCNLERLNVFACINNSCLLVFIDTNPLFHVQAMNLLSQAKSLNQAYSRMSLLLCPSTTYPWNENIGILLEDTSTLCVLLVRYTTERERGSREDLVEIRLGMQLVIIVYDESE